MGLEIVLILILVIANGLFSMAEIAVVSSRKARLQQQAEAGSRQAKVALALANDPNDFLSTTQVGITLIGTLAGAFGGATIAEKITPYFLQIPALAPYASTISLSLVVLAITYLSLILGELVPKRIGLHSPERIAAFVALPMRWLSRIAHPIVRFLSWSTDVVFRLLPFREVKEAPVTPEEIKVLIEQGTQAGAFEEAEQELVAGVFRLGDRRAVELMTPRLKVSWLDVDDPPQEWIRVMTEGDYSRYPVCRNGLDELLGVIHVKDLLAQMVEGGKLDLRAALRKPLMVPETTPALRVLEQFQTTGTHIALVVNEHGAIEGLLTLNNLLEAVVGELPDPDDPRDMRVQQREDGSYLVDGMLPVSELKELLHVSQVLPGEKEGTFTTVGGFLMMNLERIPVATDSYDAAGWKFEVVDMDGNRVDKVLISRDAVPEATESPD